MHWRSHWCLVGVSDYEVVEFGEVGQNVEEVTREVISLLEVALTKDRCAESKHIHQQTEDVLERVVLVLDGQHPILVNQKEGPYLMQSG